MIYITKPVAETHKTVPKAADKTLDDNLRDRRPNQHIAPSSNSQEKKYYYNNEDLEQAVEETNNLLFSDTDHYEFKVHEGTGRMMVKLVNNETGEVIKEIPPEKILDVVAGIWDLVGILVDERG